MSYTWLPPSRKFWGTQVTPYTICAITSRRVECVPYIVILRDIEEHSCRPPLDFSVKTTVVDFSFLIYLWTILSQRYRFSYISPQF